MGKCLVTKLNGSVENVELLRLGEMRMKIGKVTDYTSSTHGFKLKVSKPVTLEIVGNGYFTDSKLSANKGKSITLSDDNSSFWVSNDGVEVAIRDKYSITELRSYYGKNLYLDIKDFKYSNALTSLSLENTNISGDISALKNLTGLSNLNLFKSTISGNIDSLKNLTALTKLNLDSTNISGNIDSLKNLTALTNLNISNIQTPLIGDIGSLSNLTKCTELDFRYSALTGDLATLPASCRFISFSADKGSTFTWGTRASSSKIVAIEGNATLTNIDKMLQDQAQCQIGFTPSDNVYYKTISVAGTRTSASDDAVATLQQKGYTVSITHA